MEECDVRLLHAVIARMTRAQRGHVLTGGYTPRELPGLMRHLTSHVRSMAASSA
jgi:hypothetical protein